MTGPDDIDRNERIAALLDAYGADVRRWPRDERDGHSLALAGGELADRLKEAHGLDRLLDMASVPVPPEGAVGRVVTLATPEARAGNVTDLAGRSRRVRRSSPPFSLPAISALAASLLLGLYLGSAGVTDRLLPDQSAGLADGTTEVAQIYDFDVLDGTLGFLADQEDT